MPEAGPPSMRLGTGGGNTKGHDELLFASKTVRVKNEQPKARRCATSPLCASRNTRSLCAAELGMFTVIIHARRLAPGRPRSEGENQTNSGGDTCTGPAVVSSWN